MDEIEIGWSEASDLLLGWATHDLDAGEPPRPGLLAFAGDEPLGSAMLRPFATGQVVSALIELLALLIPMGADRLVLSLPGRVWSLDDPIPPVSDTVDLRTRVVVVTTADAHAGPCRTRVTLHPFEVEPQGWRWTTPVTPDEPPEAPALWAMGTLLDARHDLALDGADGQLRLAAQLGRVLLLGHELALAPAAARRLQLASAI